jgi:hypothetical protein
MFDQLFLKESIINKGINKDNNSNLIVKVREFTYF